MTKNPVEQRAEITTALFVFFAACMAYAAALTGTFVYDDIHSVASNEGVQSLSNLLRFFVDPTLFSSAGNVMYRPVLLCTFAVDHALGAGSPVPFKLTNVLLQPRCCLAGCATPVLLGPALPLRRPSLPCIRSRAKPSTWSRRAANC
jgi:hypothetical protein